jgi:uncharacterized protein YjbI with pentapeptide repeats
MKILKPQKLGLLTRCFEHERRAFLGVAILALHNFSHALASEMDMWKFLPEELGKDAVVDTGIPKSCGELLVTGSAFQPGGEPRPGSMVRVKVGKVDKTLYVIGNRYWQRRSPTEPEPFTQMPITWENAFGGEGYSRNPLGKGIAPIKTEHGPAHPLPNVELPGMLIQSKKERPEPAGLGPIDLMWPQRFSKAGTHDTQWLKERFPGFARDMDWSIFNIAPQDQHQREPFRGDESFLIDGMHPEKPRLEGHLPGMATRCFVNQRTNGSDTFCEIVMRLTTVWFFPHAERYLLIFHGTHKIDEDDAGDVLQLMAGAETLDKPKPAEHYRQVLELRLDPEKGAIHALKDSDLLPPTSAINSCEDETIEEMQALLATEDLLRKHRRKFIEKEIERSRTLVASLGLDPDLHGPAPLPPDEPIPSLEEIPEFAERLKAEAEKQKQEAEREQAQHEARVRELLIREGLDAEEILAEPKQPMQGPPQFSAEKEIEKLRTLSAELKAMGCPVEELDQYATDPERRQMYDDAEKNMREGYRQMAHHQDAAPRFSGEDAARSKASVLATLDSHGSLARLNMTGFDLSDMDLQGIDLSDAWLENANLARTNLAGANLAGAVLARADLTEANLSGADLSKANLGLAQIIRTKADGALFSEAILSKVHLVDSSLRSARLEQADLSEATFSGTDLSEAILYSNCFLKTDLRGLHLKSADLSKCIFLEVDVSAVNFSHANLESVTFLKSKGDGAVFSGANMKKACFVQECTFEQADFRRAILEDANFRTSRLAHSDFSEAQLAGVDLSECDLSRAKFYRAFARDALFVKANLAQAFLVSADLMNAILEKADLSGADLSGANLFQADLARVHANRKTKFLDTNTKKVRIYPKRTCA